MVRLPALGLAVYHLYQSTDSPLTLRSDALLRVPGSSNTARAGDPLPVRLQQADPQTFYISSQSLTLGFSGSTGLLEVSISILCDLSTFTIWFKGVQATVVHWQPQEREGDSKAQQST